MILALCNNIYLAVLKELIRKNAHYGNISAAPSRAPARIESRNSRLVVFLDDAVRREAHAARHADELVVHRDGEHY